MNTLLVVLAILVNTAHTAASRSCDGRLALVTGATGRTGRIATNLLLEDGFCVRVFSRNATKTVASFAGAQHEVEVAEGDLGSSSDVRSAFAPRDTSGESTVSHVLFAAGGEEADFDAVNRRGVAYCAAEATAAGASSMVVVSAAWVTRPYSFASLLFNALYPSLPMALHLQGEDSLRAAAAEAGMSFVVMRPGALVGDDEYDWDTEPAGVRIAQGDSFGFLEAGMPGLAHTPLARALVSAMKVEGQFTVEITCGNDDADDAASAYSTLTQDDPNAALSADEVAEAHGNALRLVRNSVGAVLFGGVVMCAFTEQAIAANVALVVVELLLGYWWWWTQLAGLHVTEC